MNGFVEKFKPRNVITPVIILLLIGFFIFFRQESGEIKPAVLGDKEGNPALFLSSPILLSTESKFREEITTKRTTIPFITKYEDDQNSEIGSLTVKQEGENGKKEENTRTIYYNNKKYSSEIADIRITEAKPKIILRGTKIVIREMETPNGKIEYKGKIHAWATSYNENCLGCDFWTATGQRVRRGIVAVDPKVIPLHTKMYIPGYGLAVAEDVGGGIKGNKVDLYFEPWAVNAWSARWVDVYILN